MSVAENLQKIVVLCVLVAALITAGFLLFRENLTNSQQEDINVVSKESTKEGGTVTEKIEEDTNTDTEPEVNTNDIQTSEETERSPYAVYLGFASSVGTSSESFMRQEVSEVVVGYEWEALTKSPTFTTVVLPQWDSSDAGLEKEYVVHVWDRETESFVFFGNFPPAEDIKLPREGLLATQKFRVTGIDPSLRICPGDRSFTWQLRFAVEGEFGLVRTPITQALPSGETCINQ